MHLYVTINKRMRFADGFYRVIPRLQSNTGKDSVGCVAAVQTVIGQVFFFGPLGIFFLHFTQIRFLTRRRRLPSLFFRPTQTSVFCFWVGRTNVLGQGKRGPQMLTCNGCNHSTAEGGAMFNVSLAACDMWIDFVHCDRGRTGSACAAQ